MSSCANECIWHSLKFQVPVYQVVKAEYIQEILLNSCTHFCSRATEGKNAIIILAAVCYSCENWSFIWGSKLVRIKLSRDELNYELKRKVQLFYYLYSSVLQLGPVNEGRGTWFIFRCAGLYKCVVCYACWVYIRMTHASQFLTLIITGFGKVWPRSC